MGEALRQLIEAEAAARSALDYAMSAQTSPLDELSRLWRTWIAANDALTAAIPARGTER